MSHNEYVRPSGQWLGAFVLTPNDLRRFDVAQYQSVNGDQGGSWAPASPIVIGGLGLQLTGSGHTISGGVTTLNGGRLVLGHSDYETFATPYSRPLVFPLIAPIVTELTLGAAFPTASLKTYGSVFNVPGLTQMVFPVRLRSLHRGATLSTATLTFRIGQQHQIVPATTPFVAITRSDYAGAYYLNLPWVTFEGHAVGDLVVPTTPNGYVYAASSAGTSTSSQPTWPLSPPGAVTASDGGIVWVNTGYGPAPQWAATTAYAVGKVVEPPTYNANAVNPSSPNGLVYLCIAGGTSTVTPPNWPTTVGQTVIDGTVTWQCVGVPGPYAWTASTAMKPGQLVRGTSNSSTGKGLIFRSGLTGTTGTTQPVWNTTVGSTTTDGGVTWTCIGSMVIGTAQLIVQSGLGADYYDGGAAQTLTVHCDSGGPSLIATDKYQYAVGITDESGFGAFVANLQLGTFFPFTAYANGQAIAAAPPNGFYYVVTGGSGTTGSGPPTWTTRVGFGSTTGSVSFENFGQVGTSNNVYHSIVFGFTGIADLRPE